MGQTLSEPITLKTTASDSDDRLIWGVSEMQGWRLTMEDSHAHVLSLSPPNATVPQTGSEENQTSDKVSFFAVYDGHGGSSVARFAGDTLHDRLASNEFFKNKEWGNSLVRSFLETDEDLRANPNFQGDPSGCTAVACLVRPDMGIVCANAGDSRAVLSVGGVATPLSHDHKPTGPEERSRITAAGGFVEFGRVNGNLALSRALGDFEFKQSSSLPPESQVVTANPDVITHEPTPEDEFLIIACDGIWDVLTSQQAVDFVRLGISEKKTIPQICEALVDRCLAPDCDWGGAGCDNMTALIVALKGKRTEEEWTEWIADRVDKGEGYATPKEYFDPFSPALKRPDSPLRMMNPLAARLPFGIGMEEDDGNMGSLSGIGGQGFLGASWLAEFTNAHAMRKAESARTQEVESEEVEYARTVDEVGELSVEDAAKGESAQEVSTSRPQESNAESR